MIQLVTPRVVRFEWLLLACLMMAARCLAADPLPAGTLKSSLDSGWLFYQGDIPFPEIKGHNMSYQNAKAGAASGAAAADFDDSGFRTVRLPHDWAVEGPFNPNANLSQGYRDRGIGWYRRYFKLDPSKRGRSFELQFDGISTECTIWVNGVVANRNFCGYNSIYIDVTPFLTFGDAVNTIAVRVDANQQEGWWYEGAGIYRHAWLVERNPVHIATDGVHADPVRTPSPGKPDAASPNTSSMAWSIPVQVTLESRDTAPADVEVQTVVTDPDGKVVGQGKAGGTVRPFEPAVVSFGIAIDAPKLWSVERPTLYSVSTVVRRGGVEIDRLATRCGFRTIRFDANEGLFVNDVHVKLQGTCNHQDHAGVGVAVPDSLWAFRLKKLKEMGSNAYRCAHNPPAKEFLDACDEIGMLVMDENRMFNTTPEYVRQLQWLVRRDRNHPSVILWSVFNEEPSQGSMQGYEMVRELSAVVKTLDTTRPVTAAQSGAMLAGINASLAADVAGFNYQHRDYDRYHAMHPDHPMTSSEDTSAVMTRGYFGPTDRKKGPIGSYDDQNQSWGLTHHKAWQEIASRPFVAGGFVWTGFDYRGEPQPLEWPSTGSSFGIMDLCGFPKSAFYIHQSQWIADRPVLRIEPHWNWDETGKPVKVMVITNGDSATLSLNGKDLGRKPIEKYVGFAIWDVPYAPGKLEAVAWRDGQEITRTAVETTGAGVKIELIADRSTLAADGVDAQPLTVRVLDAAGRPVPTSNAMVYFELSGPGEIIGLNNGDPTCHEPEKGTQHSLFNGLAQVIVQTKADKSGGPIKLRASAAGLVTAELEIPVTTASPGPAIAPTRPVQQLTDWRMSPGAATRPDPNQKLSRTDMNSWPRVQPGTPEKLNGGTFAVMRTTFRPRAKVRNAGGTLRLEAINGRAEVWLNEKQVATKTDAAPADMVIPIPAGPGPHVVSIGLEAEPDRPAGLGGQATVE